MEDRIEKIFSEAKRLSLTADEKSAGREMLRSYMALTPMQAAVATAAAKKPMFGFAQAWGRAASAFSVSLAVLLSAGSVSYAAEGALPGDILYPVKVSVNEEVRAAVTVSAQARAAWEAERAERRLDEAEQLASRGRLRAETRTSLDAEFRGHAEKAQKRIASLRDSSVEAAADVNAHLEGSLHAHKKIIAMLSDVDGEFEASIDHEIEAAEESRGKDDAKIAGEAAAEAKVAAQARRGAATHKIAEVRGYLNAKRAKLGAEATADAEAKLAEADASVAEGDAKLAAGENGAAFAAFAKAQRQAQEAKLLIRAGHQLKFPSQGGRKLDVNADVNAAVRGQGSDERHDGQGEPANTEGDDDEEHKGNGRGLEIRGGVDVNVSGDKTEGRGDVETKIKL